MDREKLKKEDLTDFLNTFSDSIESENAKLFADVIEKSEIENIDDPDGFYISVLYTWDNFLSSFLTEKVSNNNDVLFIYKKFRFLESHITKVFSKIEGSPCSADKSRTIIGALVNFYKNGEKIIFDYESEYTYHLPKKVLKTHEDIISYYESLRNLYNGNPESYLNNLKLIYSKK